MKSIPAANFLKQYKSIKTEIDAAISRVLKSGWYILGREVENFEKELSKFLKIKYAVGVASGTDALTLSIQALDLKPDDEIIIPANSYPSAFGVFHSDAKIALADVDPKTLNVSLETLKAAVTKETKAILVVHMYGNPAEIIKIKNYAKKKKLLLIEDCAQAIGATYNGVAVGSFGDISCFSFYPTKNLGAIGDAGAIATNDKKLYERVKLLRCYGEENRYNSILPGYNSRLDELQAAILSAKLKHLKIWTQKRRSLAKLYTKLLKNLPIQFVSETENAKSVYHLFVIKTEKRDELLQFLKSKNIAVLVHYPVSVSKTQSLKHLFNGSFPVSENASDQVLSLPLFPEMTTKDVEYTTSNIREFFKQYER